MTWSLSEVEAKARTAARGGGYSWGLADDVGRAVRWLCARGVDPTAALADLLTDRVGVAYADTRPRDLTAERWTAQTWLCPITAGAAMSDLACWPETLGDVRAPILLLPFLAEASEGGSVRLNWSGGRAIVWEGGLSMTGPPPDLCDLVLLPATERPRVAPVGRANPDPEAWQRLDRFAHRTLAPATEESRLRGAG